MAEPDLETEYAELTEQAHAARGAGERDRAQRLFDQRAELAARMEGEQSSEPKTSDRSEVSPRPAQSQDEPQPVEAPIIEPFNDERVGDVVANLRSSGMTDDEIGDLQSDWGNDFGANLGYAEHAIQHVMRTDPEFAASVDTAFRQHPESAVGLIRVASSMGRQLASGGSITAGQIAKATKAMAPRAGSPKGGGGPNVDAEIARLTAEAHTAFAQGNNAKANQLFAQRKALAERYTPEDSDDGIVGSGPGRNF